MQCDLEASVSSFIADLFQDESLNEKWKTLSSMMYEYVGKLLGHPSRKHKDSFDSNDC